MQFTTSIENIEAMRQGAGIDDMELRRAILRLAIGDFVKLTFLGANAQKGGETVLVRITSIRGGAFRGKLAVRPKPASQLAARVGAFAFTAAQIHSLPRAQAKNRALGGASGR